GRGRRGGPAAFPSGTPRCRVGRWFGLRRWEKPCPGRRVGGGRHRRKNGAELCRLRPKPARLLCPFYGVLRPVCCVARDACNCPQTCYFGTKKPFFQPKQSF